MEIELESIISRIKEEGVASAQKKSDDLISQAKEKAKEIIDRATKEKEEILKKTKQEVEKMKANGEIALKQACRDVLLFLREKIIVLFDQILKQEICRQLSTDVLKEMIVLLAKKFEIEKQIAIEILLNEKDKKDLEEMLLLKLKKKMEDGITFRAVANIDKGLRIGKKGDNVFYDFTDEAIAENLSAFLNPRIREILNLANLTRLN